MSTGTIRSKPLLGGVFGKGKYSLATMPCLSAGLHAVRYMVIEPRAGAVLAIADEKTEAIQAARRLLRATEVLARIDAGQSEPTQVLLWPEEALPIPSQAGASLKQVPKRRREVFERSGGACHYCGTVLQLDGKYHVEHMQPRALGGDDDPLNLVLSCVACNLAKSDHTALEFVAAQLLQ